MGQSQGNEANDITLAQRCAAIEVLILDVDGVLTDGGIVYGNDGNEVKRFHVRDGAGLKLWHRAGKRTGIVTGRTSKLVETRAAELGIDLMIQGADDKLSAFRRLLKRADAVPRNVCYVGDDLPDLPPLCHCGLAVAVADACPEVRESAHYITRAAGGRGAVREIIEVLLRRQGAWQGAVDRLRGERL
jgi:3-deoxy-D-manno-octulosonate 8-phosphate phosphatase (KDO 8-P phosphatase)